MISIKLRTPLFFVLSLVYFVGIYLYFDLTSQLHYYFIDYQIYIEFGHADLLLIVLILFCYLNGFLALMVILNKRWKLKTDDQI